MYGSSSYSAANLKIPRRSLFPSGKPSTRRGRLISLLTRIFLFASLPKLSCIAANLRESCSLIKIIQGYRIILSSVFRSQIGCACADSSASYSDRARSIRYDLFNSFSNDIFITCVCYAGNCPHVIGVYKTKN